jgi:hypothetical protein
VTFWAASRVVQDRRVAALVKHTGHCGAVDVEPVTVEDVAMNRRTEAERRESFRRVNASCAIEGMVMTREDLALQERVIRDEITHEAAIAEVRKAFDVAPLASPESHSRSTPCGAAKG